MNSVSGKIIWYKDYSSAKTITTKISFIDRYPASIVEEIVWNTIHTTVSNLTTHSKLQDPI